MEFKIGDKVKVIKNVNEHIKGKKAIIVGFGNSYDYKLSNGGYINKENIKLLGVNKKRIAKLEKEVEELKLIIAKIRKPSTVITNTITIPSILEDKPKSPNQLRAEMIEKAKDFIVKNKFANKFYEVPDGPFGYFYCDVEFIVNEQKRTVVALMRSTNSKSIKAKGIAKCIPDDVYNEHIGKAIALGRALGLDVSEFEQAVQPNETVEGMLIDTGWRVLEATDKRYVFGKTCHINSDYGQKGKIINDTNAQYGGVE